MPTFTPPTSRDVGTITGPDRYSNDPAVRLFRHFRAGDRGVNVYQLTTGAFVQDQPDDETTIVRVFHGGHDNTVTAAEAALLTAAGYGSYLS